MGALHTAVVAVILGLGLGLAVVGLLRRRRAGAGRRRRTTPEIRAALLGECERAYHGASSSARGVRAGIIAAEHAIRAVPDEPDPRLFVEHVLIALAREREALNDPADDDGFALGGLATIRNAVERVRDEVGGRR